MGGDNWAPSLNKKEFTGQASSEDLEKRIVALEERNAIQEVTAKYCYFTNEKKLSELMDIFHDKAQLDVPPFGHYKNKEEIKKFFSEIWKVLSDLHHLTHNHLINLNGEEASCICHFEATCTGEGKALICAGTYDDKLVKENGKWVIISRVIRMSYLVPLNEGWTGERKVHISL